MPGAGRSRPGPTGSSPGNEPSSPSPWGRAKGRPGSCDAEHQLGSLHQTGRALNRSLDALQLEPVDLGQDPGYLQLAQANEPSSPLLCQAKDLPGSCNAGRLLAALCRLASRARLCCQGSCPELIQRRTQPASGARCARSFPQRWLLIMSSMSFGGFLRMRSQSLRMDNRSCANDAICSIGF